MKIHNIQSHNKFWNRGFSGNINTFSNTLQFPDYGNCTPNDILHRELSNNANGTMNINFDEFCYNNPDINIFRTTAELEGAEINNKQEALIKKYLFTPVYKISKGFYSEPPNNIIVYSNDQNTLKNYTDKISLVAENNVMCLHYKSAKDNLKNLISAVKKAKISHEETGKLNIIVIPEAYKFIVDKKFSKTLNSAINKEDKFGLYFLIATEYPKEICSGLNTTRFKKIQLPRLYEKDVKQVLQHYNDKILKDKNIENNRIEDSSINIDIKKITKSLCDYKECSYLDLIDLRKLIQTTYQQFINNPEKDFNQKITENINYYKTHGVIRNENKSH